MKKEIEELPEVLTSLVNSQNAKDSATFVLCFSEDAKVHDEGHTYSGKKEIRTWNEETTKRYDTYIKAQEYEVKVAAHVVTFQVSGKFDGSPIDLKYDFKISGSLITALTITSD